MKSFLLLALFIFTACAPSKERNFQTNDSVVNGQDAMKVSRYNKAVVSVWYPDKFSECTGVYIGNGLVLTAAHCKTEKEQPYICFSHDYPGIIASQKSFKKHCVQAKNSLAHRHYVDPIQHDTLNAHDIRLIKFEGKIPVEAVPMNLPSSENQLKPQQIVTIAGFGLMNKNPITIPSALQIADIKFISRITQTEIYFDPYLKRTACNGDSGGPVYIEENGKATLVGIISRGAVPAAEHTCNEAFIATEVVHYLPWIESAAKVLEESP